MENKVKRPQYNLKILLWIFSNWTELINCNLLNILFLLFPLHFQSFQPLLNIVCALSRIQDLPTQRCAFAGNCLGETFWSCSGHGDTQQKEQRTFLLIKCHAEMWSASLLHTNTLTKAINVAASFNTEDPLIRITVLCLTPSHSKLIFIELFISHFVYSKIFLNAFNARWMALLCS